MDTLDKMSGISCDLVSETLGGDLGDFRKNFFIDVKVIGELLVMFLEKNLGCSFDGFCSDSAHKDL